MAFQELSKNWYAIFTKYNAEQKVSDAIALLVQSSALCCETYLPLQTESKVWSDRVKQVQKPLFRNYLFVKHDANAFSKIKHIPGFVSYVSSGVTPTIIPEQQMQLIRKLIELKCGVVKPSSLLSKGKRVEVIRGPLAGYKAVITEDFSANTVAIKVDSLRLFVAVKVPVNDVLLLD